MGARGRVEDDRDTATPSEPPTRWSTSSCGLASERRALQGAECGRHRGHEGKPDAHAADEHGHRIRRAPIRPNGIVATVHSVTPNSAKGPPPQRSVNLPASGIINAAPRPGRGHRPVSTTLTADRLPVEAVGSCRQTTPPQADIVSEAMRSRRRYRRQVQQRRGTAGRRGRNGHGSPPSGERDLGCREAPGLADLGEPVGQEQTGRPSSRKPRSPGSRCSGARPWENPRRRSPRSRRSGG